MKTRKIYAIIKPPHYNEVQAVDSIIPHPLASIFHKIIYESICGYSLGHEAIFFDSLDAAKNYLSPVTTERNVARDKWAGQFAIVRLRCDEQGQITDIDKIYHRSYGNVSNGYIVRDGDDERLPVKVYNSVWDQREVTVGDLSDFALSEINRQYQEHYYKYFKDYYQNHGIFNSDDERIAHAKAHICQELASEFDNKFKRYSFTNSPYDMVASLFTMGAAASGVGSIVNEIGTGTCQPDYSILLRMLASGGLAALVSALFFHNSGTNREQNKKSYISNGLWFRENLMRQSDLDQASMDLISTNHVYSK